MVLKARLLCASVLPQYPKSVKIQKSFMWAARGRVTFIYWTICVFAEHLAVEASTKGDVKRSRYHTEGFSFYHFHLTCQQSSNVFSERLLVAERARRAGAQSGATLCKWRGGEYAVMTTGAISSLLFPALGTPQGKPNSDSTECGPTHIQNKTKHRSKI